MGSKGIREYNPAIMAIKCRGCGAEPLKRCKPKNGNAVGYHAVPPHQERRDDAEKETK